MTVDDCTSGPSGDSGSPDELLRLDWMEYGEPSSGIVEAVARAADRNTTELTPLHDVVETDALNVLLADGERNRSSPFEMTFSYAGFRVTASSDGDVVVRSERK